MDVRLVQLLGSFINARGAYALARLECAMHDADLPAPPIIGRLTDASEQTLRQEWPVIERQLDAALAYEKHLARGIGRRWGEDPAYRAFDQALRELDQCARAIRWVLTVTESEDAS
jgi:hypothetical protein